MGFELVQERGLSGAILSIESSCDDSSVAVTDIETKRVLFHKKISQESDHALYGGVVPELASRLHAVALPSILERCREFFGSLKAVAVTSEPGLSVTLMEGVAMAQALAISMNLPLIGVNHLVGHVYSLFIESESVFPLTVLLVSGGHTMIMEVYDYNKVKVLASTLDDSFGESFDKVAKMMGLGYPGGPLIEELAKKGDPYRFSFPVPLKNSKKIAFSYSGLKNAVRIAIEKSEGSKELAPHIAASFQRAAIEHLVDKSVKILDLKKPERFAIVGGASANMQLRDAFLRECDTRGIELLFAPLEYCSDNAVMIGRAAIDGYKKALFNPATKLKANPKSTIFGDA